MPKIVDHAQRRDDIALVACRVVAEHGFDQASMVRIAREAGYTTGMLAHYNTRAPARRAGGLP
ncbi:MAG TPA: TetR family transcriptional regulator [Steroidobacteraceae bacterium]|jgi:AcrR family transcriptional regulator|nr:TetR family transcriptional regulator [Steroidobacteraceae bacterium]